MEGVGEEAPQPSSRGSESKNFLTRSLNDLLERYLYLLDQYQSLQQDLSSDLSKGYICLAQANFSNQNHNRYGQDFFDQRMQATTHISLATVTPIFSIVPPNKPLSTQILEDDSRISSISEPIEISSGAEDGTRMPIKGSSPDTQQTPRDPLNWFGILSPPALRQSQVAFKSATTGTIPQLANVVKEMKDIELEVRRTRKKLRKAG